MYLAQRTFNSYKFPRVFVVNNINIQYSCINKNTNNINDFFIFLLPSIRIIDET